MTSQIGRGFTEIQTFLNDAVGEGEGVFEKADVSFLVSTLF